jgi:Family of unknown function (DUF6504)
MSRRYGNPVRDVIDVRTDPSADLFTERSPTQFLWRGRLYVVRGVLAHWIEVGAWWRARLPDGLPVRIDESGREVWRVEAGAGRASPVGVYDLVYDEAATSWTLARTHD